MNVDRVVFWGVLVVVVGVWVAVAFGMLGGGLFPIVIALAVTLVAAFVGAWNLDRGRRIQTDRHFDDNAPNFYAPLENQTWQVPTSYIDHRTGGGSPPGVDDGESHEDVEGDREGRRPRGSEDPAP
ncbi:MAG TPA: hypothetical protein VMZ33_04220 [Candidatus Limnocylindrales bacterium]|nr:hypothetical protein [Candidatus Limnocylindrales bacterium]